MLTSNEIRRQFIDFFVSRHGHTAVPSSPVVPHDDPTLLFANAGMNQFKDVFLGVGSRPFRRAVDTQKCIRAGGKHNDLEDVGKDTYHHTFFEMLGNWSFGDYFKAEAIRWAWELLTDVWKLDKSRLHATVFEGSPDEGVPRDDEAFNLWKSETDIDPARIHWGNKKDNFWEMGDTGPCGPCSEIHIDLTQDRSGRNLVNAGDPRVMEIWNLVFIQFNRGLDGKLESLPAKHVDTGMGFERVCAVIQGKKSNYDTDVFTPIFHAIREVTKATAYTGELAKPEDIAYRVIADHIRALTFAITDGAAPSNEGRGYVLRRILRRAVRYGRQTLGVKEPFFYRLVDAVANHMGDAFPELRRDPEQVAAVIREEEELFTRTLDRGIEHFSQAASRGGKQISGKDAFELYATYGFPLDLTQLMAEERGLDVDVAGFDAEMEHHQEVSKGKEGRDIRQSLVVLVQKGGLPDTQFVGYEQLVLDGANIVGLFEVANDQYSAVDSLSGTGQAAVVLDSTPFYAESGGQVGDQGVFESASGRFRIEDTVKVGGVYFHLGTLESGRLTKGSAAARVDETRRRRIMAHHTATHLMNRSLRAVLGEHVQQRGSLVDDQKTRFDLNHNKPISIEEIERIEQLVQEDIRKDLPVYAGVEKQEDALKIHGLRAVFGEKYPPLVRVVSIGVPVRMLLADAGNKSWYDFSIEFCGGTHLATTSLAEDFVIVAEESVAKGIRRVIAVAGEAARSARAASKELAKRIESLSSASANEAAIAALIDQVGSTTIPLAERSRAQSAIQDLQRALKEQQKQQSKQAAGQAVDAARQVAANNSGPIIVAPIDGADAKSLLAAMDVIKGTHPESAVMLACCADGKVSFAASVPKALIGKGLKAGDWVREVAKITGGGGGGRPDSAQAGGKDPAKLPEALKTADTFARQFVG